MVPGVVESELWTGPGGLADQIAERTGSSREEVLESTHAKPPLGRMGTEAEIAAAVVFLCSEAAPNIAGAAWSVDGGSVHGIL